MKMSRRLLKVLSLTILVICSCAGYAQDADRPLTNDDVIQMVKSKQATDTIVLIISRSKTDFNTSTSALIELSQHGVPKAVLDAMLAPKPPERSQDEINFRANLELLCRDTTTWKTEGKFHGRCQNFHMLSSSVYLNSAADAPTFYNANRFLDCVSKAMVAEMGENTSLFDPNESLITFRRVLQTPLIPGIRLHEGVRDVCRNLEQYYEEIKRQVEAADKPHQKLPKDFQKFQKGYMAFRPSQNNARTASFCRRGEGSR